MNCEICGAKGDIHHIVYRGHGGLNFELNYKYLCKKHHRGIHGPHKNKIIDYKYKLEMQDKLCSIFIKTYYSIDSINEILRLSISSRKKIQNKLFLYKEGYKNSELIFFLMGDHYYNTIELEDLILQTEIDKEKSF